MLTVDDLIAFCDLRLEEVQAIAEHEHMPVSMAAVFGQSLLHTEHGTERIRDMLMGAMRLAVRRHDVPQARHLVSTLRHFLHEHPDAAFRQAA
jgi:hypothetical protein